MRMVVMMSAYNGEKYLDEQILSILNQKVDFDIDLVVRDDGSSDNTINILEKYSKQGKLTYIKGDNIGSARSFIQLLKKSVGYDYYAFADQDDVWFENKLQSGFEAIKDIKEPALYCSNVEVVDEKLNSFGGNLNRKPPTYSLVSVLCNFSSAQGCTSIFNSELAKIIQENEVPKKYYVHDILVARLCMLVGGTIIYDHKPTLKYRQHGNNVIGVKKLNGAGIREVLKVRLSMIFNNDKSRCCCVEIENIMNCYESLISNKNKKLCRTIIASKHSLWSRIKLILDRNLKCPSVNMTVTRKLQLLLGNG